MSTATLTITTGPETDQDMLAAAYSAPELSLIKIGRDPEKVMIRDGVTEQIFVKATLDDDESEDPPEVLLWEAYPQPRERAAMYLLEEVDDGESARVVFGSDSLKAACGQAQADGGTADAIDTFLSAEEPNSLIVTGSDPVGASGYADFCAVYRGRNGWMATECGGVELAEWLPTEGATDDSDEFEDVFDEIEARPETSREWTSFEILTAV